VHIHRIPPKTPDRQGEMARNLPFLRPSDEGRKGNILPTRYKTVTSGIQRPTAASRGARPAASALSAADLRRARGTGAPAAPSASAVAGRRIPLPAACSVPLPGVGRKRCSLRFAASRSRRLRSLACAAFTLTRAAALRHDGARRRFRSGGLRAPLAPSALCCALLKVCAPPAAGVAALASLAARASPCASVGRLPLLRSRRRRLAFCRRGGSPPCPPASPAGLLPPFPPSGAIAPPMR